MKTYNRFDKNDYITDNESKGLKKLLRLQRCYYQHLLKSAPPFASYIMHKIWLKETADPYQRYICRSPNCKNRCRTYYICHPS